MTSHIQPYSERYTGPGATYSKTQLSGRMTVHTGSAKQPDHLSYVGRRRHRASVRQASESQSCPLITKGWAGIVRALTEAQQAGDNCCDDKD